MASTKWFCSRNGQKSGPFTSGQLLQLAAVGQLKPQDLILQEGGKNWVPAGNVKGLFEAAPSVPASEKPPRRVWPWFAAATAAALLIGGGVGALLFSGKNEPEERVEAKPAEQPEEVKKPYVPPAPPKEEEPKPKPEKNPPAEVQKPDPAQVRLEDFQRYLKAGKALQEAKQFDASIKAFTEAVNLMPENAEALAALKAADQARIDNDALERNKRDQDQKSVAFRILLDAGQANLKDKQFDLAVLALGEALRIKPGDAVAAAALAEANKGRAAVAAGAAAQAALADRQKRLDEYQKRMAEGRLALFTTREFNAALRAFGDALKLFPNDPAAAGFLLESQRARDGANAAALVQGQLLDQELTRIAEVRTLLIQGREAMAAGNFDFAARAFFQAFQLAPNDFAVLQAQQDLQRAIELAQKDNRDRDRIVAGFRSLLRSGRDAIQAKRYDDAVTALSAARRLIPDDREAEDLLAQAIRLRDDAQRAADTNRQNQEAERNRAEQVRQLLMAGRAALARKDLQTASKFFNDAKKLSPADGGVLQAFKELEDARAAAAQGGFARQKRLADYQKAMFSGRAAQNARHYREAVRDFTAAAQLVRGDQESLALYESAETARQAAQMALDAQNGKKPEGPQRDGKVKDLLGIGRMALANGQFANAESAFTEARKLAPMDPMVMDALRDLDQARKQALQFDLRIEPGQLRLPPGGRARVRIVVNYRGRQGPPAPIDVELRKLPGGVGASRATIPAGQTSAEIEVGTMPGARGVHNDIVAVASVQGVNGVVISPPFMLSIQKK